MNLAYLYLHAGWVDERQRVSDGAVLTRLFSRRGEGQAQVRVVFCVQPPLVLLSAPSHTVQTNPWDRGDTTGNR